MKPVAFPEANVIFAEEQPEYLPLPALRKGNSVTSCWELSEEEIETLLRTKRIFFTVLTFGKPLQPQRPHLLLEDR